MANSRVVVDTTIWSLALRRQRKNLSLQEQRIAKQLKELIVENRTLLLGPVRMELLSGIRDPEKFEVMVDYLDYFDDVFLEAADYVRAARFWTKCRSKGIATSVVDMLVCSVASGHDLSVFSSDDDFRRYAEHLPFSLHPWSLV